jgi:hypothetical protein
MSNKKIRIDFGTREQQRLRAMKSLSKDGIKMLLCYGVSYDDRKNKFVCDCKKSGCSHAGKHPIASVFPKGEHSATTDLNILKSALKKHPNANLAVVVDGFFVIDIDGPKGAKFMKSFKAPPTLRMRTGRGHHYYFRGKLTGSLKKIEQVDIKTKGYVMFETSRHISGVYYRRVL